MYEANVFIHGVWRWAVLLCLITVVADCIRALLLHTDEITEIRRHLRWLTVAVDVQVLLGTALYAQSPVVRAAWSNMGAAMKNSELRFFLVEHPFGMFAALILVHLVPTISRRKTTPRTEQLRVLECVFAAALIISVSIPWWRPLLRF